MSTNASSSSSSTILKLKTLDDEIFEVKESVAMQSLVLNQMVEDGCTEGVIPLENVTGPILSKILEWCNKHEDGVVLKEKDLKKWESDFMDAVSLNELYFLILGSNYLNVKELLNCACQKVADMIKGKSPEEIRKIFNIKNDFTPEEEEELQKENQWTFQ